jgi:hypothetical protein
VLDEKKSTSYDMLNDFNLYAKVFDSDNNNSKEQKNYMENKCLIFLFVF